MPFPANTHKGYTDGPMPDKYCPAICSFYTDHPTLGNGSV